MNNHPYLHLTGAIHCTGVPGDASDAVLARPKLVALLAILACAPERHVRRDVVLALLWPDLDQDRARAGLRKAVFTIRRHFGAEAIANRGNEEIGLGDGVNCDVVTIRHLLADGDVATVLTVYRGELLPGFHLSDAPEFEHWLDQQRDRLQRDVRQAALRALVHGQAQSETAEAAQLAARVLTFGALDEPLLRASMEALAASGDIHAALRAYEQFSRRIALELDTRPTLETQNLAARLRDTAPKLPMAGPLAEPPLVSAAAEPVVVTAPRIPMRRMHAVAFVCLLLLSLPWLLIGRTSAAGEDALRALAVSHVVSYLPGDSVSGPAVMDMLATSLARIRGLPVFSTMRLYEAAGGDANAAAITRAARKLGANELLEGALHQSAKGVRLELRRVDAATGSVIAAYSAEAPDVISAVNRATVQIASSLGLPAPAASIASVTTMSAQAYELYEQGLRAWYRVNIPEARALFGAAVAEDSTFAMASWMLANSLAWTPEWIPAFERAVRLSERATDRERLMIRASYAAAMEHPARAALADTLARRYPSEPAGHQLTADALFAAGRFLDAVPHLRRVIHLDTLSLLELSARCVACDAMWSLGAAYAGADSLEAQVRVWTEWNRIAPGSAAAAGWLAFALANVGRYGEAEDALRRMHALDPDYDDFTLRLAALRLHEGRFDAADTLLVRRRGGASPGERASVFWHYTLLRLNEGRYSAALAYADSFRLAASETPRIADAYLRVIVLLHAGEGARAAEVLDSMAQLPFPYTVRSRLARDMTMNRSHYADALAVAGDRKRLAAVEDSIRRWGQQSGYVRDQRMHHHARGLRHMLAGKYEEAAMAFTASQFGARAGGYARTNLLQARAFLAQGRSREALRPLRLNLESNIGADKTWVSRTEAHELLAYAHDRLGNADSARVHYAAVLYAWRNADANLHERRQAAARNLQRLQAGD